MIEFSGSYDQTSCTVLHLLQSVDRKFWYAKKKAVAEVKTRSHFSINKSLCGFLREARSDVANFSEMVETAPSFQGYIVLIVELLVHIHTQVPDDI